MSDVRALSKIVPAGAVVGLPQALPNRAGGKDFGVHIVAVLHIYFWKFLL